MFHGGFLFLAQHRARRQGLDRHHFQPLRLGIEVETGMQHAEEGNYEQAACRQIFRRQVSEKIKYQARHPIGIQNISYPNQDIGIKQTEADE